MPHPLEMCAFTSVVGVSLHPHGITWNSTRVNIVFLLAINSRDRLFFKDEAFPKLQFLGKQP
ncbi:MAG: hypothetical protein LBP71_04050 [Spirochaetaceae bacterium]|jgi:hypothetical protein|nr:hypothetical protein [Spirochaetaceae bacterium]